MIFPSVAAHATKIAASVGLNGTSGRMRRDVRRVATACLAVATASLLGRFPWPEPDCVRLAFGFPDSHRHRHSACRAARDQGIFRLEKPLRPRLPAQRGPEATDDP